MTLKVPGLFYESNHNLETVLEFIKEDNNNKINNQINQSSNSISSINCSISSNNSDSSISSSSGSDDGSSLEINSNNYYDSDNNIILSIEDNLRLNKLFKQVFKNKILFKLIFKYSRLYGKYEIKEFKNLKSLREFRYLNYVHKLIYSGEQVPEIGDLPFGGVLKIVKFTQRSCSKVSGHVIPDGVEIIEYKHQSTDIVHHESTTPFSTFPNTVHTIINAVIQPINNPDGEDEAYFVDNGQHNELCKKSDRINGTICKCYQIPSNIKSISFKKCVGLSSTLGDGGLVIPNTIRILEFGTHYGYGGWRNLGMTMQVGAFPEGVVALSIRGIDIQKVGKGVLPNSLKELQITCDSHKVSKEAVGTFKSGKKIFDAIPPNVEILVLGSLCTITANSNLSHCKSIKKLTIQYHEARKIKLKANSLPSSLLELQLSNISGIIKKNSIPPNVKHLSILFNPNNKCSITKDALPNGLISLKLNKFIFEYPFLPPTLNILEFTNQGMDYTYDNLLLLLSKLPKSVTFISLPNKFEGFRIAFPSSIKKIKYNYY